MRANRRGCAECTQKHVYKISIKDIKFHIWYCLLLLANWYLQIGPRKKLFFLRFAVEHPLHEKYFSWRKIKITYIFRRNSAKVCGETPRHFAEKICEISQWVGKDLRFHADSEDSDQTEKLERMPSLIWVSTQGDIKPTQNRYVPNIITGCVAIGQEQCTCNCYFKSLHMHVQYIVHTKGVLALLAR